MSLVLNILKSFFATTKRFYRSNGSFNIETYPNSKYFSVISREVTSFDDLYKIILDLSKNTNSFVIRGELNAVDPNRVRKTLHDKENEKAFFHEVDRAWICWDCDDKKTPFSVDPSKRSDLERAAKWLVEQMPAPFSYTNAVVQFSSTAFINKETGEVDPHKIKAHLWYLLDEAVCNQSLKEYAKAHGLDPATTVAVQPNYTANPIFEGMEDPLCRRIFKVQGLDDFAPIQNCTPGLYDTRKLEEIKAEREAVRQAALEAQKRDNITFKSDATKLLANACDEIRYASEGLRHSTIKKKSFWIGRLVSGGYLDHAEAHRELEFAVASLFPPSHQRYQIEQRCLNDLFNAGFAQPVVLIDRRPTKKEKKAAKKAKKEIVNPVKQEAKEAQEEQPQKEQQVEKIKLVKRFAGYSERQRELEQGDRWCGSLPDDRFLAVNASFGTGKTEQVIRKIAADPNLRVLWIDHRIALSQDVMRRLQGLNFVLYLDAPNGKLDYSRMVVCADSLFKVTRTDFDLVVIDEADQTLFSLFKKGRDSSSIITRLSVLEEIFIKSKQIMLLSADLDEGTTQAYAKLAHLIAEEITWYRHRWIAPGSTWLFCEEQSRWKAKLLESWGKNEKIAVFCASRKEAEGLVKLLEKKRPTARVLSINSECKDHERKTLADVNVEWIKYDAVVYTTSAGAGVSFDVKNYFDRVFVWGKNQSTSFPASEYRQGAARVRSPKNLEIVAYITETWRPKQTREELLEGAREYERDTLRLMKGLVPFECNNGQFVRSENHPLIVQVWLDYMEIKEDRTASQCYWLLKSLLSDRVKIMVDETQPDKPTKKAISKDSQEAKQAAQIERATAIATATPITYDEATALEGTECKYDEMRSVQRHQIGHFYQGDIEPDPKTTAPTPSIDLILTDNEGEKRAQLRRIINAGINDLLPAYHAHLDASEGEWDAENKQLKRSAPDAKHHTLKAQSCAMIIAILDILIPGLAAHIQNWQRGGKTIEGDFLKTIDENDPAFKQAISEVFKLPLPLLGIKGLSENSPPQKIVGDLLRYLGIKRDSHQHRLPGGGRERVYTLLLPKLYLHLSLGEKERDRACSAALKWLEQSRELLVTHAQKDNKVCA